MASTAQAVTPRCAMPGDAGKVDANLDGASPQPVVPAVGQVSPGCLGREAPTMLGPVYTAQLSEVISQATAPSFLLGAVSGFVAVLIGRMNDVIGRARTINAIADDDVARVHLKGDVPRLVRRARLLNRAIYLA